MWTRRAGGVESGRWSGVFGVFGDSGRACGRAGGPERSGAPGLIEVVFGQGFRLSGIRVGCLVEVVGEGFLDGLYLFRFRGAHVEFGLGRPPGGMEERGRGGLPDVEEDLGDGLWVVG
jgi:hypothetical protein